MLVRVRPGAPAISVTYSLISIECPSACAAKEPPRNHATYFRLAALHSPNPLAAQHLDVHSALIDILKLYVEAIGLARASRHTNSAESWNSGHGFTVSVAVSF